LSRIADSKVLATILDIMRRENVDSTEAARRAGQRGITLPEAMTQAIASADFLRGWDQGPLGCSCTLAVPLGGGTTPPRITTKSKIVFRGDRGNGHAVRLLIASAAHARVPA
jgi:hypothetical protein